MKSFGYLLQLRPFSETTVAPDPVYYRVLVLIEQAEAFELVIIEDKHLDVANGARLVDFKSVAGVFAPLLDQVRLPAILEQELDPCQLEPANHLFDDDLVQLGEVPRCLMELRLELQVGGERLHYGEPDLTCEFWLRLETQLETEPSNPVWVFLGVAFEADDCRAGRDLHEIRPTATPAPNEVNDDLLIRPKHLEAAVVVRFVVVAYRDILDLVGELIACGHRLPILNIVCSPSFFRLVVCDPRPLCLEGGRFKAVFKDELDT